MEAFRMLPKVTQPQVDYITAYAILREPIRLENTPLPHYLLSATPTSHTFNQPLYNLSSALGQVVRQPVLLILLDYGPSILGLVGQFDEQLLRVGN
ncbi:hypothetical protein EMCRGX_G023621 [Ephydatia muelleri]